MYFADQIFLVPG